jgi:hypothetical protein
MNFERHLDPKESMEIGRKKDAIEIEHVEFDLGRRGKIILTEEKEVIEFLERFRTFDLPTDLIFRPHRILLSNGSEDERDIAKLMAQMSPTPHISQIGVQKAVLAKPVARKAYINIRIGEYAGKTILVGKKMILIPTIEEIFAKMPWLEEDEREFFGQKEREKIQQEEFTKIMIAQMEADRNSKIVMEKERAKSIAQITMAQKKMILEDMGISKEEEEKNKEEMKKELSLFKKMYDTSVR